MRAERRERERMAEDGKRLEEEYFRKEHARERRPLGLSEKPEGNYDVPLVPDTDQNENEPEDSDAPAPRHSRHPTYIKRGHGNVLSKRLSRSESDFDDDRQANYDTEAEEDTADENRRDEIDETRRLTRSQHRKGPPQVESDLELGGGESTGDRQYDNEYEDEETMDRRRSRRDETSEVDEDEPSDTRREGAHYREDSEGHYREVDEGEAPDTVRPEEPQRSDTLSSPEDNVISDVVAQQDAIPDGNRDLAIGEHVRAFHHGMKEWQGGKVADNHQDGTVLINWDSGSTESRLMNATDVYRPPVSGNSSPFRFEGPNAYDMIQEQQNRISGHALTPSTKKTKKEIFDGYTLFNPSDLPE